MSDIKDNTAVGLEDKHIDNTTTMAFDEKAKAAEYKLDAIQAENAEHNMTVLQAVKEYPMASFWAFVMSFCIVSQDRQQL